MIIDEQIGIEQEVINDGWLLELLTAYEETRQARLDAAKSEQANKSALEDWEQRRELEEGKEYRCGPFVITKQRQRPHKVDAYMTNPQPKLKVVRSK